MSPAAQAGAGGLAVGLLAAPGCEPPPGRPSTPGAPGSSSLYEYECAWWEGDSSTTLKEVTPGLASSGVNEPQSEPDNPNPPYHL